MQHELPSASADDQRTADTDTMLSRRRFCNRMVGLIAGSTCIGAVSVQGSRAQPPGTEIVGRQEEPRVMPDSATPYFAYVSSRTTRERNARGDGLSVYRIDPKAAAALYREHHPSVMGSHTKLLPGVEEGLKTLREEGIQLGICSNKPSYFTRAILKIFHIDAYFGIVLGPDNAGAAKPDPAPKVEGEQG